MVSLSLFFLHCELKFVFFSGIPYLNLSEETKYKENLDEAQKIRASNRSDAQQNGNHIAIPKDDRPFINQVLYV